MLKELLKPEIKELIDERKWNDIRLGLSQWSEPEIAELLLDIDKNDRVLLFRALPRDVTTEVFSQLEYDQQDLLLHELTDQETKILLADMTPDDRTALLEELPSRVTMRLFNLLSPEDLKEARFLLGYPEDSIGRLMTPDFVAVRPDWTISQTLAHIRIFGKDSETINRIYVTDNRGHLIDDILLRYIILSDENQKISDLMDYNFVSVSAFEDQEEAVKIMEKYDISAIPVVDSAGNLVGIVTFDDIMDISVEEATEDFQRISGINPVDQTYLSASVSKLWWKRIPWLFVLLITNFFTAGVLSLYSHEIETVVALTFFIPMLLGTAGNTGTQSATLIIRSLATGDIEFSDWFRVVRKELLVGLMLGLVLGCFSYFRGLLGTHGNVNFAIVISLSMIALVMWSNIIGALLPLIITKFKLDPAVISSPFISTFTDVTGLIIYFNIAIRLMGL